MERTLTVKKERLAELTTDELRQVAGAGEAPPTLQLKDCVQTLHGCTTAINCPRPQDA